MPHSLWVSSAVSLSSQDLTPEKSLYDRSSADNETRGFYQVATGLKAQRWHLDEGARV